MINHERCYKLLGLQSSATAEEIKRAYRSQASRWHPDRITADAEWQRLALARMQELNECYATLKNHVPTSPHEPVEAASHRSDPSEKGWPAPQTSYTEERSSTHRAQGFPAAETPPSLERWHASRVPFGEIECMALDFGGTHVWAGGKGLLAWAPQLNRAWGGFPMEQAVVTALCTSAYGEILLVGTVRKMMGVLEKPEVILFYNGHAQTRLQGIRARVTSLTLSPDNKQALAGDANGNITLWDIASGRRLHFPPSLKHARCIRVAFCGEGSHVVSLKFGKAGEKIVFWDATNGKVVRDLTMPFADKRHSRSIRDVSPASNGHMLLVVNHDPQQRDQRLHLWDMSTGQELHSFKVQGANIVQALCVPYSERILAADEAGFLHLWNLEGQELGRGTPLPGSRVVGLTCSVDGETAMTTHPGGVFALWKLP